jgi:hypothetical protein
MTPHTPPAHVRFWQSVSCPGQSVPAWHIAPVLLLATELLLLELDAAPPFPPVLLLLLAVLLVLPPAPPAEVTGGAEEQPPPMLATDQRKQTTNGTNEARCIPHETCSWRRGVKRVRRAGARARPRPRAREHRARAPARLCQGAASGRVEPSSFTFDTAPPGPTTKPATTDPWSFGSRASASV